MKKIDEIVDRVLEAKADYYVANMRGYKTPQDPFNDGDMFLYMNMLLQNMRKKGKLKVGQWTAFEEDMMGTWGWSRKGDEDTVVYMTPFFESDGINTQTIVWKEDGEDIGKSVTHKFTATGDETKDFNAYMSVVKKVLSNIK